MELPVIIGKNIRSLMESKSVTTVELAKELSISRQTLNNYLKGSSTIDTVKLVEISNYFKVPAETLLKSMDNENHYLYRTVFDYSLAQEEFAEKVDSTINLYYQLAKKVDDTIAYFPEQYNLLLHNGDQSIDINFDNTNYFTKPKLPEELKIQIKNIAFDQRKKLGLFDANALTAISVLQNKGINIFFVDFGDSNSYGVSYVDDEKGCFIFVNINSSITLERIIFTVFHEYGHIILHRPFYKQSANTIQENTLKLLDKMADCFAGCFLVPEDALSQYDSMLKNITSVKLLLPIKKKFQVSLQSFIVTLCTYHYVNQQFVDRFFKYLEDNDLKKIEHESISESLVVQENFNVIKNEQIINKLRYVYKNDFLNENTVQKILWLNKDEAINLVKGFEKFDYQTNESQLNKIFEIV